MSERFDKALEMEMFLNRVSYEVRDNPKLFNEIISRAISGVMQAEKESKKYGVDMEVLAMRLLRRDPDPSEESIRELYNKHSRLLRFTKEAWDYETNKKFKKDPDK